MTGLELEVYEILKRHFSDTESATVIKYFKSGLQEKLDMEPEVSAIFKKLFSESETEMIIDYCRNKARKDN